MPELTGEWEFKLSEMERGRLDRDAFMQEIAEVTRRIVERAKNYQADTVPGDYATLSAPCPKCGGVVQENYKRFACTSCDFSISKHPGARQLDVAEVEQLLRERTIGPLQGFRSRLGRPFAAILRITPEHKLEFDFGQGRDGEDGADAQPVDFSEQTPVGACPKCGASVFEHGMSYVCEKSVGPGKSCDFRTGKIILQQEISREQASKLLDDGRTDLLPGFVSSRTRRKFKAFLVRGADGKVGFEFEPRPARPARAGAAKRAAGKGADESPAVTPRRSAAARTTGATAGKSKAKTAGAKATGAKAAGAKAAGAKAPAAKTRRTAAKKSASSAGKGAGAAAKSGAATKRSPAKKA